MSNIVESRAVIAKVKTPWIFAFITTGILVLIWTYTFVAWAIKRARKRIARRNGKTRCEKSPTTPPPSYIIPPDPALIRNGKGELGMDPEKVKGIFSQDNGRPPAIERKENGGAEEREGLIAANEEDVNNSIPPTPATTSTAPFVGR